MQAVGKSRKRSDRDSEKNVASSMVRRWRRPINPSSPPTTVEIRGVPVHFPFKPYPCQETYMEKVMDALLRSENALLESPTGTGKTLCLLCATLAWQRQQAKQQQQQVLSNNLPVMTTTTDLSDKTQQRRVVPTIIYASRTHSQLSQVVSELRNTRYRPKHAVLASREQMCVHPKVKTKTSTASDINHGCQRLNKERQCRYRNNLETRGFAMTTGDAEGEQEQEQQPILDLEDLVGIVGKKHQVCPFYYTRSLVETAELVLVPYNYLFDKDARTTTLADIPWNDAVIIFDEAHNLESFAGDSASFDLSNTDIAGCIQEVHRAINYMQAMPDLLSTTHLKLDNLLRLKALFLQLEEHLLNLGSHQTAFCGEYMMEFFRQGAGITHPNHEILIDEIRKVNDLVMDMRGTQQRGSSPKLEHFVQCLKRVYGYEMESQCLAKAAFYRVYVSPPDTTTSTTSAHDNSNKKKTAAAVGRRVISYWCFAPALAMQELANLRVRSILVTSGTLSPLPSYGMELGLSFPHTLENPHIITGDQIHVRVIGKGVSGKLLTSSYERRKDTEYFIELGNTITNLSRIIPEGMLIFFPSYGVMETCLERWGGPAQYKPRNDNKKNFFAPRRKQINQPKQYSFPQTPQYFTANNGPSTPWKRLLGTKAIVIEPRSSSDLPDAIAEFKRFLALPRSQGCILMGVCRGKISEGIDFAGGMSRAVLITGLPFAPTHDPKVKLKKEYLDGARIAGNVRASKDGGFGGSNQRILQASSRLSGQEWYIQQAHRAVNQAVGRVIRNRADYGAVILLDSRFDHQRNQEGLSKWLRPHIQRDEGFGVAFKSLKQFYTKAAIQDKERIDLDKKTAVELDYEEETSPITKVAVVQSETRRDDTSDKKQISTLSGSTSTYVAPEKVVARLDVKDIEVPTSRTTASVNMSTMATMKAKSDKSKFDGVFVERKAPNQAAPSDTKAVAAQFMQKIKAELSSSDQSTIRKAIVAMKTSGNQKDVQSYIQHARTVLVLICRSAVFESVMDSNEEPMVFLFFRLLPRLYREKVEAMAMTNVFEGSTLCEHCKENLSPLDSGQLKIAVISLLRALWCSGSVPRMSKRAFLEKTSPVLRILNKAEKRPSSIMVSAFTRLVPKSYVRITQTLYRDIQASASMGKRKELERSMETTVDTSSLRLPPKRATSDAMDKQDDDASTLNQNVPNWRATDPCPPTSNRKRPPNSYQPPSRKINPYVRKQAAASSRATSGTSKRLGPSLANYLKQVESETYVQQSAADLQKKIPSNAPKNLVCPLCSSPCNDPFMAECGHMACLSCWLGWLRRSQSCPTCRKTVTKESLAKAVFAMASSAPTLSQLCSNADATEEDTDEVLEIC